MTESTKGWVLYDDGCGFCREWVPFWAPTLRKRGFGIAPSKAPGSVRRWTATIKNSCRIFGSSSRMDDRSGVRTCTATS